MIDMLVKLYDIPILQPALDAITQISCIVRPAMSSERIPIVKWVNSNFNGSWARQTDVSFIHTPPTCWVAICDKNIVGFAAYDATCLNFFGPTGVAEEYRGKKIGTALLLGCLHSIKLAGYGYAIIGGAGKVPSEFYKKVVKATVIEGSSPGIYAGRL